MLCLVLSRVLYIEADIFIFVKGTVRIISSDPPCEDGNACFSTAPRKALFDKYICINLISMFKTFKTD